MQQRVRAILITADGALLVIKRERPGIPAYWVLPGGGVEPGDASLEAALHREIWEELAGRAEIDCLLHTLETPQERQHCYLARIQSWDFARRTGPEFSRQDRGRYTLEEIPLTPQGLERIDLKPGEIAQEIRRALADGRLTAT